MINYLPAETFLRSKTKHVCRIKAVSMSITSLMQMFSLISAEVFTHKVEHRLKHLSMVTSKCIFIARKYCFFKIQQHYSKPGYICNPLTDCVCRQNKMKRKSLMSPLMTSSTVSLSLGITNPLISIFQPY